MPLYWNFLGWAQIIAALLLLTQRWALLGAMAFFGIIMNIFIITLDLHMRGTPVVTFLMLLATAWLLIWDWERLRWLFYAPVVPVSGSVDTGQNFSPVYVRLFAIIGFVLMGMGLVFLVWLKWILVWLVTSVMIGIAPVVLVYRWKRKYGQVRV